ncbi:MAG: hypothetical protein ACYCSQ_09750 [bacterium]
MAYALYYPTIEFQNMDFFKKSLLIWDKIFRIVPAGYEPYNNRAVQDAISAEAVVDLYLDDKEKEAAGNEFMIFYEQRKSLRNGLTFPSRFSSHDFISLHPEKTDAKLQAIFQKISSKLDNDGFMRVPKNLGDIYMFYLAKIVAQKRNLNILTDSADSWTAGTYFAEEGNFNKEVYNRGAEAYLCNLAINGLLPDKLSDIPMKKILKFVNSYRDERSNFQNELEKLKEKISKYENKEHAIYDVKDFIKNFEKAKTDYRKSMGFFNKRDTFSLLSTGVTVFRELLLSSSDIYNHPLKIGVDLLLWGVSAYAVRELIGKDKGVASYLVSVEKLNASHKPLHTRFNELIND